MQNPFLKISEERIIYKGKRFIIIKDTYPVSPNHLLIISKEPKEDFFSLSKEEQQELPQMITKAKEIAEKTHQPDGYNIGMNCGEAAGQTVFHFHCHVIPRYIGDMKNPRGGVRHCILGKGDYICDSE